MSGSQDGPDERERTQPGDSAINPTGAPAPAPGRDADDTPAPRPGTPDD